MKPYYEHNGIAIWHGDCRDILPQLEPVDLVLTDPPYGIGEAAGKNATRTKPFGSRKDSKNTRGTEIKAIDYENDKWDDLPVPDDLMLLALGSGNRLIIFGGNYYSHLLKPSSCWLVWDKDNTGDFADCELAWTNLPQAVRKLKYRWNGMLQEPGKPKEKRQHPTQKPLQVITWCISQADRHGENNTILDPFMGSGTTLRAAKDLGRKAIGIEIEEKYCEIAAKRLSQEVLL